MPSRVKKCVLRFSISSSGTSPAIALHVASKARVERVAHAVTQKIDRQDAKARKRPGKKIR
jgi:hypothetical protein